MKVGGRGRSHRPNWLVLRPMQTYSSRGWVYREGQGWIFAELTPDELAEFKLYEYGITIPRMRVRLPYSSPIFVNHPDLNNYANWFAHCTMNQTYPLLMSKLQIYQITNDLQLSHFWRPVELGDYETWLWADEVKTYRELGCEITIHQGYGWHKWGVPKEWKPPLQYKERIFIYAFVNELTQEVYVGQSENVERRRTEHLRDTANADKATLIQSLRAQGQEPKPIALEEVAGERATERERYWTSYYKSQGYKIINRDYKV
jgi:GIY-YIG catalytic domain